MEAETDQRAQEIQDMNCRLRADNEAWLPAYMAAASPTV